MMPAIRVRASLPVCSSDLPHTFANSEQRVAKDIRALVGCAVRTIANKELRLPNGAHGAPYIAFSKPSTGEGLFLEFTGSELRNHRQTARYP